MVPVDACAGPGVREKYAAKHLKSVCGQIGKAGWPIWPDASRGGSYPMPDLAQFKQELRIIKKAANSVLFQQ
ncbi:hypothetical protein DR864_23430 [Runella rosea]|uniref:Uncharacterized protein n=1 Tax=Runella rosea TaxID=2259595 RepID=A0A344TPA7_9BACT|nr:hypothetical protein DR864_23430 [Runella rosea]